MDAERQRQPTFRLFECFQAFAVALLLHAGWGELSSYLPRNVLGARAAPVSFTPVPMAVGNSALEFVGAWELRSEDPRFGGFSDVAVGADGFMALTDSGVIAFIDKPFGGQSTAVLKELPRGPQSDERRTSWDTEALEPAPDGQGYWVSFEQVHQLWLYDSAFRRALRNVALPPGRWVKNLGVEGVATEGAALMLFPEGGPEIGRMEGSQLTFRPVDGLQGLFSEAARLSDGRLLALERSLTPLGFRNALVEIEPVGDRYRIAKRHDLPVGALDNLEGMSAEPQPGGRTRLWLISDDNFQRPLRTLLLAIDLPPKRRRGP